MTPSHNACRALSACILFHTLNIQWRHCNYSLLIPTLPNLPVRMKPGCLFPPLRKDFRARAAPSCHCAKTPLSLFFPPKILWVAKQRFANCTYPDPSTCSRDAFITSSHSASVAWNKLFTRGRERQRPPKKYSQELCTREIRLFAA